MQIISGLARGIELEVPPGSEVRPTSGRARKALFDSLGAFHGAKVADIFAGSGALGLESASRGAESILLVEKNRAHLPAIERNIQKVRKTGVECDLKLIQTDALAASRYVSELPEVDVIFADPPYATSADFFNKLIQEPVFLSWGKAALLVWEVPEGPGESGNFINRPEFESWRFRKFGSTTFFLGVIK